MILSHTLIVKVSVVSNYVQLYHAVYISPPLVFRFGTIILFFIFKRGDRNRLN